MEDIKINIHTGKKNEKIKERSNEKTHG